MATRLPRLNVTVTHEQHSLLMRLGRAQGRSAASYLRQLLDASTASLEALLAHQEQVSECGRRALDDASQGFLFDLSPSAPYPPSSNTGVSPTPDLSPSTLKTVVLESGK